jgi:hypothetical protein
MLYNIYFLYKEEYRRNQRKLGRVQPPYRISRFSDISLNDVLYFHDCAHGDGLRADKNVTGSTFPGFRMTVPWIARMPRMYIITDWTNTTYTFFGWAKIPQESAKLGCQCNHRTEYPDAPDISLNDVCSLLP